MRLFINYDIVVNIKNINISYGVFTIGHEFTVIGKNKWGCILKDNEYGIVIKNTINIKITLKIDHKKAKIIHDKQEEMIETIKFISKNCPHKSSGYEEYTSYIRCRLKLGSDDVCKCKLDCMKYISNDKIKNNKLVSKYLRRMKLKKITKII